MKFDAKSIADQIRAARDKAPPPVAAPTVPENKEGEETVQAEAERAVAEAVSTRTAVPTARDNQGFVRPVDPDPIPDVPEPDKTYNLTGPGGLADTGSWQDSEVQDPEPEETVTPETVDGSSDFAALLGAPVKTAGSGRAKLAPTARSQAMVARDCYLRLRDRVRVNVNSDGILLCPDHVDGAHPVSRMTVATVECVVACMQELIAYVQEAQEGQDND